ncbi:Alpha/Beta hydrolase protein [Mucidula mucida]|nr:Alpha/Beta hydrolase protein [Mucidula mucida]
MGERRPPKYAETTVFGKLVIAFWIILLPFHIGWKLAINITTSKSWTRIVTEGFSRYFTDHLKYNQIQWLQPDTFGILKKWTRRRKVTVTVDELPSGAKLLWMGPKRLDKVILYIHGGGFVFPLSDFAIAFWNHVCSELHAKDEPVGMVFLAYKLYPDGKYPDHLRAARDAIAFLLESGVKPSCLQIAGESAGGNIVLQLMAHILHPLPAVPPLPRNLRFAGVFLMSPWVYPSDKGGQDQYDVISSKSLLSWGHLFLKDVPPTDLPYVEVLNAPKGWFTGMDNVVNRMLLTSGSKEGMVDTHKRFYDICVGENEVDVTFLVDEGGLHDSLIYDFSLPLLQLLQKPRIGPLTPKVIDWLAAGFEIPV